MIIERARRLARRRLARRGHQATWREDGPQRRDDPLHAEAVRPRPSRGGRFPDSHGPLQSDAKRKIYQQYQRGESVEALAKRFCRTRTSIYRIIAEMPAQRIAELPLDFIANDVFSRVRSQKREDRVLAAMPEAEVPTEEAAAAQRLAALSGEPVRGAAVDAETGGPPVPQDELPEVQGGRLRAKLDPARPKRRPDGPHRPSLRRGRFDQEPDHPRQPAAGGLDRQAARRPDPELLRVGQRRQHVADAGGREVRLRAGQQVQHLRQLGDHEELRPHHPRRTPPPRPVPHQPGGDVHDHRGRPGRSHRGGNRTERNARPRSKGFWNVSTSASSGSSSGGSACGAARSR